jgi:cell division septal protein FtsQ
MALFKFKKTVKKEGRVSNISKLRSPYLKNIRIIENRKGRVKKTGLIIPPAKIKTPSVRGKKILALILSLGIMGFIVYALFFSDYFLIKKYKVEQEGTLIESNESLNAILSAKIGSNLVLLNEEDIVKEIKNVQPEIDKIKIVKIFPDTIKASFEKFPTAANIVNTAGGIQKKFLVDSQGFLIEENAEDPNLPYIKIETKDPLQVRKTFLQDPARSAERLKYIIQAINLYEEKFGMKIMNAVFKTRERELHLYTEKRFYVILDMEKDLAAQIEKLKKSLSKLDIYNTPLLYIDLRISGNDYEKVIFKRK